jgi:hypothetical protein
MVRTAAETDRRAHASLMLALTLIVACSVAGSGCSGDGPTDGARSSDGGSGNAGSGSGGGEAGSSPSGGSGSGEGGSGEPPPPLDTPSDCPELAVNQPPEELRCTGLYTDVADKAIAPGIEPFLPAHQLWSDGAEKDRWIYLPPGTQIDSSDADDWRFPQGTKLFKEFRWNGRRVETRMFWKTNPTLWLKAAYRWNADETEATRFGGGDVDVDGDTYHIPTGSECDQCHKGRIDRALGFEVASLALPGATGMTLQRLIDEDLLTAPPSQTEFEIGDDGTGQAAAALGWLHVNCGVSCHNDNSTAEGFKTDMYLRLPAEGLDGRSPAEFDLLTTTLGIDSSTPRWSGRKRIVAGSPEDSLLYQLISMRDPANPKDQMPPIASRIVDDEGVKLVGDWIRGLSQ